MMIMGWVFAAFLALNTWHRAIKVFNTGLWVGVRRFYGLVLTPHNYEYIQGVSISLRLSNQDFIYHGLTFLISRPRPPSSTIFKVSFSWAIIRS